MVILLGGQQAFSSKDGSDVWDVQLLLRMSTTFRMSDLNTFRIVNYLLFGRNTSVGMSVVLDQDHSTGN